MNHRKNINIASAPPACLKTRRKSRKKGKNYCKWTTYIIIGCICIRLRFSLLANLVPVAAVKSAASDFYRGLVLVVGGAPFM